MRFAGQQRRTTAATGIQAAITGRTGRTGLGGTAAMMIVNVGAGGTAKRTRAAESDPGVRIPLF